MPYVFNPITGNLDLVTDMESLSGTATAAFDFNSQNITGVGNIGTDNNKYIGDTSGGQIYFFHSQNEIYFYLNGSPVGLFETSGMEIVGNLALNSGNITVNGTVDGRDVATDGANLDEIYTIYNPISMSDADQTIEYADLNKTYSMDTASDRVINLPNGTSGTVGKKITVIRKGSGKLSMKAVAGDYIADSSSGGYVECDEGDVADRKISLTLTTTTLWSINADTFGIWNTL